MSTQLVLEASALASVIGAAISYFSLRKSTRLNYITMERKKWRDTLRQIAEELEGCPYEQRRMCLTKLKTRINAYGIGGKSEIQDAHIWDVISEIERCDETDYDLLKEQLILYLALLLKYDWERSKKEVLGESLKLIIYALVTMTVAFGAYGVYEMYAAQGDRLEQSLPDIVLIITLGIVTVVILRIANRDKKTWTMVDFVGYLLICVYVGYKVVTLKGQNNYIHTASFCGIAAMILLFMIEFTNWLFGTVTYVGHVKKIRKQKTRNDDQLKAICDEFEREYDKNKDKEESKYVFVKKKLSTLSENELKELKIQASQVSVYTFWAILLSAVSFAVALCSLVISICPDRIVRGVVMVILIFVALGVWLCIYIFRNICGWQQYIIDVTNELLQKNTKNNNDLASETTDNI